MGSGIGVLRGEQAEGEKKKCPFHRSPKGPPGEGVSPPASQSRDSSHEQQQQQQQQHEAESSHRTKGGIGGEGRKEEQQEQEQQEGGGDDKNVSVCPYLREQQLNGSSSFHRGFRAKMRHMTMAGLKVPRRVKRPSGGVDDFPTINFDMDDPKAIETCAMVKKSWNSLKPLRLEPCIKTMYTLYTSSDAHGRSLLEAKTGVRQHRIFAAMLGNVIQHIDDAPTLERLMAPVALKHFLCAIDSKQYIAMRKALITSLKLMHTEEEWWGPVGHPPNNGHHGEVISPLEEAWIAVYNHMCHLMLKLPSQEVIDAAQAEAARTAAAQESKTYAQEEYNQQQDGPEQEPEQLPQ